MMNDLSFLDKLKVLVDVSSSSGICIASIFILIFLIIMMLTTNKSNSKQTKILYIVIYMALIIAILVQYSSSIETMFDYMMNNLFIAIYFPNLAIYSAAIIATNIILWKTIFNFKEDRLLKVINTIIYALIHYLLVLILNVVVSNKLDVFDNSSVYSDQNALALIGLSSTVFVIWIIFIIIYKKIRQKQKIEELVIEERKTLVKDKLPSNIIKVDIPKIVRGETRIKEKIVPNVIEESNLIDFYKQDNEELQKYDNMLTLEDYKTVLSILKNKNFYNINNEQQLSTDYNDDKIVIPNIDNKIEQPKLDQLLNLYKKV